MTEREPEGDFLSRAERQIVDLERGITERIGQAKELLQELISRAKEKGRFPTKEIVYPPDQIGSKRANPSKEEGLLIDIQAKHQSTSNYILLMGDGSMVRYFERRYLPKGPYDHQQRVHYDSRRREVLSDYEYVVLTPVAARAILRLLS